MPGMSDHDIVSVDFCIKQYLSRCLGKYNYIYHKANWDMIHQNMIYLWNDPLFLNDETSTAKQLWAEFRDTAIHAMNQYIRSYHVKYLENAMAYHG